jgi:hypothetical protein
LEAADSAEVATSAAAVLPAAVIPAEAGSMLLREGSAVVVPLTSIVEGWVSQVGGRVSLRRILDRCGLRFSNPTLPQGLPGVVAG